MSPRGGPLLPMALPLPPRRPADPGTDCRTEQGVMVGLIDGMLASARVVTHYLDGDGAEVGRSLREALLDLASDEDVARLVVSGGEQ